MSALILCCSGLRFALDAAQKKMNTDIPILEVDRIYHRDPKEMRSVLLKTLAELPKNVDLLLIAQGFCGGSWDEIKVPCKTVIPRVDDCITIALQNTDQYQPNLKVAGHMYIAEPDPQAFSPGHLLDDLKAKYGEESGKYIFDSFFEGYHHLDIIDTGYYDCYDETFVTRMQSEADLFGGEIDFLEGGNRILEKLISGQWDDQFLILEPGMITRHGLFFE